jgi:hypothetical protein
MTPKMEIYEEPQCEDEPVVLSLEDYRRGHTRPDDHPPRPSDDDRDQRAHETYWSGRNHAMRRSARWAA